MDDVQLLIPFIEKTGSDCRIGKGHLALYAALVYLIVKHNKDNIRVFSHEVMPIAKISHGETYHLYLRQLAEYGYIEYTPSYNRFKGSRISLKMKGQV